MSRFVRTPGTKFGGISNTSRSGSLVARGLNLVKKDQPIIVFIVQTSISPLSCGPLSFNIVKIHSGFESAFTWNSQARNQTIHPNKQPAVKEPMFAKLPLKWRVLLGTQGVVTTFLIARRMDPETFDKKMFEKRVLEIKRDSEGSIKIVPDSIKKE